MKLTVLSDFLVGTYSVLKALRMYVVISNHLFPLQANVLYSHIVDVKSMGKKMNKLNWLIAFVIVAIIFASAFVYKTPIGAPLAACDE